MLLLFTHSNQRNWRLYIDLRIAEWTRISYYLRLYQVIMITSLFHLLSNKLAHRLTLCTAFPESQFIASLWDYLLFHLVQSSLMLQFHDLSRILCFNKRCLKVYSLLVHLISHLPQLFLILTLDPLHYDRLFFIT